MRASVLASVSLLLALSANADAQTATKPPAPLLTIGGNLKELDFDWDPVPGVGTYRLFANTGEHGYFEPISDRFGSKQTHTSLPISVHTLDWPNIIYMVQACNPAGCTRSNNVAAKDVMLETIGYLKASNTGAHDHLGTQVALSADGNMLAMSADLEDGDADSLPDSGAVYVYRRDGRRWSQEALLKASDGLANTRLGGGTSLAYRFMGLSADGTVLAVGAPTRERSGHANAGVVFVFQRVADHTWSQVTQLTDDAATTDDYFGYSVDVSSDGNFIKVSSAYPQGGSGTPTGRTHLWSRGGGAWSKISTLAPYHSGDRCPTTRFTADAKLLISACLTASGDGRLIALQRSSMNTWSRVGEMPYRWLENPNMAVTYDGSWLALHDSIDFYGGAIGIYSRSGSTWKIDTHWLAPPGSSVGYDGFGHAMDFSRHGDYLAFSEPNWTVAGAGSQPTLYTGTSPDGAVLVLKYRDNGLPDYMYTRVLKAPHPGAGDHYGWSVAFGGPDGSVLAIGAPGEDSAATGVNGNQLDESAQDAGAVYLH